MMGNKFDYRSYDEDAPVRESRKDQKIKHQIFDRRTGRIHREDKGSLRVVKRVWEEERVYGEED